VIIGIGIGIGIEIVASNSIPTPIPSTRLLRTLRLRTFSGAFPFALDRSAGAAAAASW
jgi:hypothetical protein